MVLPPVRVRTFHPYSDEPPEGINVTAYAYVEAFAEKTRALGERARPRDLYDVVNLFRRVDARPEPSALYDALHRKCAVKGLEPPNYRGLVGARPVLEGAWDQMLSHQLRWLPPFDAFWDELPRFFGWLETGHMPSEPQPFAIAVGEAIERERSVEFPHPMPFDVQVALRTHLDVIRFAAANRICVELDYQGSTRVIEPYSLRRTKAGDLILHAHSRDNDGHRSYRIDWIEGVRATSEAFVPRHAIELTPSGPIVIP